MTTKKTAKKQKGIHNPPAQTITNCMRCGTCCRKGGPALHKEDERILLAGHIKRAHLITIRKGELAFSPVSGGLERAEREFIKIAGKGRSWTCFFFDEKKCSCAIYAHRPLECRLLKCWDTAELLPVIGQTTLCRADIIGKDDPILKYIGTHEKECSVGKATGLISAFLKDKKDAAFPEKLAALVQRDLEVRSQAVAEFGLSLEEELFFFGRPLFKIMGAR